MHRNLFIAAIVLLISGPLSVCADTVHNHDPALVGQWFATAVDGSLTSLQLEAGGKFILDQRAGTSVERTYMCGTWERDGRNIEVDIQARKTQSPDGDIVEADTTSSGQFTVLRATANSLVLRINRQVVSLYRS